ncbi:NLR family CARD domain-containing protein 4-like, partial [Diadema setosum]|uniref:NLR family CARD domain-containing protein 4-like n=1 Tax=Diadema setosum TaxID=31175 RepID=UPI003B3B2040
MHESAISDHVATSVVDTAPKVLGWKWDDTRLPCAFQEAEPLAVAWVKETITGQLETKARFFDGNFESREERFNMNWNFSLVITDLEVADEGLYICQVALSESEVFENSTFVTVNSMASKHVIEECVDESLTSQSQCTYQTPSDTSSFNLTCVVSGFKPNISMFWTEESGERLNFTVSQQITLSDDTYERFETITVSSTHQEEQTFICIAIGDPLNGTSTTGVYILPISEKSNNFGLAFGLTFVVLAVVILVLLVGIFLQRHNTYLVQKESLLDNALTDEQVQQCKNDLKVYYRKTRRKVTVDPLNFMERVNLDEIYTNLSLIDKSSMRRTPITYEDLLTNDEIGNLSKRLLIQGEGGVGKTTLCAKIAWDWCQERILQDLDMVIVIPLRDVTVDKTIGSIVEKYLSDSNEATPAQIDDYISTNLSKVLLVFDGFDEFNERIKGNSSSEVIRILGLEQYESCKVIVTSRPWRTEEFRLYKSLAVAYTFISVEGFNKKNLRTYIKRYFRIRDRNALAESLVNFMDENDVIRSNMAPFPIYCAMLCLMWNDFSEERRKGLQKLQTFSEIFCEMITFLKEHYASKSCENLQTQNIPEDIEEASTAIQAISETALDGLLERKLSFPEKQFEMCHVAMETCCKVGVLTIEKDIDRKLRRDANVPSSNIVSTVSFPHKLFQEYIACVRIGSLFANDRPRYNKVKKKLLCQCEEFRYLLYFASASEKELGLDIIDSLIEKGDQYFCLDVAFECHTEEAASAMGKRWENYKLSSDMSEHTKAGVVFMGNCNQTETLLINDVSCGKTVSRYLAEGMCSSSVLRKVTLENPRLHTDFYMIMGKKASNCQ